MEKKVHMIRNIMFRMEYEKKNKNWKSRKKYCDDVASIMPSGIEGIVMVIVNIHTCINTFPFFFLFSSTVTTMMVYGNENKNLTH